MAQRCALGGRHGKVSLPDRGTVPIDFLLQHGQEPDDIQRKRLFQKVHIKKAAIALRENN